MKTIFSVSLGCQSTLDFQVVTLQLKKCRGYARLLYSVCTYRMNFIFVCGTGVTVYAKRIKFYQ